MLELALIEIGGIEIGHPCQRVDLRLTGIVGNFKTVGGIANDDAEFGLRGEGIGEIAKLLILRGVVMDGCGARCRRLDAAIILQVIAGEEIIHLPRRTV